MVKQFSINLNRQEGFVQKQERVRKLRERITLLVVTLLLFGAAFITVQNDMKVRDMVVGKKMQLDRIIADIDSLQKVGQNVSKEDVLALARLDNNRVLWTKKFVTISQRLPEQMAITGLEYDRGVFTIKAISQIEPKEKEFEKVSEFMDKLKASPVFMEDFRNIKFKESKRINRDDQEILSFVITCKVGSVGAKKASRSAGKRSGRTDRVTSQLRG